MNPALSAAGLENRCDSAVALQIGRIRPTITSGTEGSYQAGDQRFPGTRKRFEQTVIRVFAHQLSNFCLICVDGALHFPQEPNQTFGRQRESSQDRGIAGRGNSFANLLPSLIQVFGTTAVMLFEEAVESRAAQLLQLL
jgi:hypothetical protein